VVSAEKTLQLESENLEDISLLKDEVMSQKEVSVSLTLNLSKAITNYFETIDIEIKKRTAYKKANGRLDYLVVRRFLWTMFNNLIDLDLNMMTPKVKALSGDLKLVSNVYDDLITKVKHPNLAYEEVFLSCQSEYIKIREGAQKTIEKLNALKNNEKYIGEALKVKKAELQKNINPDEFELLTDTFKSMNGAYVDVVHMMAELDERYKHDMKLLVEFEKEYKKDFYELFETASLEYKRQLRDILSAQAYILDAELWREAKGSVSIKKQLQNSGVRGSLNTKTYLQYYLNGFEESKMTEETKRLYRVHEYLCELYKESVMLLCANASEAIEYKEGLKGLAKSFEVKAFVDESAALKWASKNSVKVLIIEERLSKMRADVFLKYYKKEVFQTPKILLLGTGVDSSDFQISKRLRGSISQRLLAQSVEELIKE